MKKLLQILAAGLLITGQISAKTVFFPDGPQKFEVSLPFAIHTLPSKAKGLPIQIAVLGKEGSAVYVYEGNKERTIKKLSAEKIPEDLLKKAESTKETQEQFLKNIFLQGSLPSAINFLPGEFKSYGTIKVSSGVFQIPERKDKDDRITSRIFIKPGVKWALVKFEAKSETPEFKGTPITLEPTDSYKNAALRRA